VYTPSLVHNKLDLFYINNTFIQVLSIFPDFSMAYGYWASKNLVKYFKVILNLDLGRKANLLV